MKTIKQALIDEIIYPLPEGLIDNKIISRQLDPNDSFSYSVSKSDNYMGCFADCLVALVQSVSFSESDKSVSTLTDEVKKRLLYRANSIYDTIGEERTELEAKPMVYINC